MTGWPPSTGAPLRPSTPNCYPATVPHRRPRVAGSYHVLCGRSSVMTRPQRFTDWDQLALAVPDIAAPMRRYLQQLTAILRPGSVSNADQALRSLATFLTEQASEVRFVADI